MRVAIYAGMYKENQDGATRTLYKLTSHLLSEGIETGIWGFSITPRSHRYLKLHKVLSVPIPFYKDYRLTIPNPVTINQIKEFSPDIIHITVPDLTGQLLTSWARKRDIPVITSYHTDFISYLPTYKLGVLAGAMKKYFRYFYNRSLAVYAPTTEAESQLKKYGIKNTRIWSRGINLQEFSPEMRSYYLRLRWGVEKSKVILFAGRFVWYKGLDVFIDVYQELRYRKDIRFVLAGDGPIRTELEKRMPEAIFTGYLKGRELAEAYASSDLFLFPSVTETFGNVVQEALASGIPAIVSDVGGCKEIIKNSDAGLIAEAGNSEEFASCCLDLIDNPVKRDSFRNNGLQYVKTCSWKIINSNLVKDYSSYINGSSKTTDQNENSKVADYSASSSSTTAVP